MVSRRRVLAGLAASSLMPSAGWGAVGAPAYLSAGRAPDGAYLLAGLSQLGDITFTIPLPARGHAAAAHPERAEAVAFARRPGTFAVALDCRDGTILARLTAPEGRHFYGHGAFSADGRRLFTSENDFEVGEGVIGVWDVAQGYRRIGEFRSGGVGPHDVKLMPDGKTLVVANGGIETHPDMGRAKLNIPMMTPNLSYLSTNGALVETVALPTAMHKSSIRHLALRADGLVAFAMQWEGAVEASPALLGLHRRGKAPDLLAAPPVVHRGMQGYAGSVSISGDGRLVGITSPRGNRLQVFEIDRHVLKAAYQYQDVCGLGAASAGFYLTTGVGEVGPLQSQKKRHPIQWDNHLVPVGVLHH